VPSQVPLQATKLTLSQALQIGLENNFDVQIARNTALQADNNAEGLRGIGNAGMLPNLTLTAGANEGFSAAQQRLRSGDSVVSRTRSGITDRLNAAAQLDWTLFNGLRMFATLDRLKEQQTRGQNATKLAIEALVAQIMRSYYDAVLQQATLRALQSTLETSRERLKIASARESIGSGSHLEVLRATVDLNSDSGLVLRQYVAVRNAKAALHVLLTRTPDDPAVDALQVSDSLMMGTSSVSTSVNSSLGAGLSASYSQLLSQMQRNNIALQDARSTENVSEAALREASSVYFPTLGVTANYTFANTPRDDVNPILLSNQSNGWNIGAALQWTLFNGFNNDRSVQNARLDLANAETLTKSLAMRLEGDLARAYRTYQNSIELVKLEDASNAVAQETERLGLERFKLGALTALELRDVQVNALRAETRMVQAQFETKVAEIDLMRLTGQLVSTKTM
jgi:outer membrane protein